jgi:N6-adenosine-specific RNA methylase IME4
MTTENVVSTESVVAEQGGVTPAQVFGEQIARQFHRVIVADPPWEFENRKTRGAAEDHYRTMTTWEIMFLPVDKLGAGDAVLLLWTTDAHLPFALSVMKTWGFTYKTKMTWIKVSADGKPQMGLGNYVRHATELCLFGTRGKCPPKVKDQLDFFWAPRDEHSAKPLEFYSIVERMYDGPYLELFNRDGRQGWDTWGFESGGPAMHPSGLVMPPGVSVPGNGAPAGVEIR